MKTLKLKAAILDWAGTTVDHGSIAPVRVLEKLFDGRGVPITADEARLDMGLLKKDHIRSILGIERVRGAWIEVNGTPPSEASVESLFAEFIPRQLECLAEYSTLIPGVIDAVAMMRGRGMKIGTTTGYTRPMLDLLLQKAAEQGYRPDSSVCPDDVGAGRPAPLMCYENAVALGVYPLHAYVKIGDTISDIEEGLNAGMWTVGVVRTGNLIGLTEPEFLALTGSERGRRLAEGRDRLSSAGAHYVIDGIAGLEPIVDLIDERLGQGEQP
jgi:phosphonoacetaldehyde hydrolase